MVLNIMSNPTELKLVYGNYAACKKIISGHGHIENLRLKLSSDKDTSFVLDTYPNVTHLTVNCNIKYIKGNDTDKLVYLSISKKFPILPSMRSLTTLHCNDSTVTKIPTLPNLRLLKTNCAADISYQPSLEELDIGYNKNLKFLPSTPKLKTLICNDTRLSDIPQYFQLEFLLCFDTKISIIPESVCETLKRCYIEHKPRFMSKPTKLIEVFSVNEDIHYLKDGETNCIEYNGIMLLHNIDALINRS